MGVHAALATVDLGQLLAPQGASPHDHPNRVGAPKRAHERHQVGDRANELRGSVLSKRPTVRGKDHAPRIAGQVRRELDGGDAGGEVVGFERQDLEAVLDRRREHVVCADASKKRGHQRGESQQTEDADVGRSSRLQISSGHPPSPNRTAWPRSSTVPS